MLADCDAGNVVTAAQAGAQWGYRLLSVLICLIPLLYIVQELTVRLGIFTGRGHGELVRSHFGPRWAWLSATGLIVAVVGSLVTEFTGIAGVGEMYGVSRAVTLPLAVVALISVVFLGSHRRVEKAAMLIGGFELVFFFVAWKTHPEMHEVVSQITDLQFGNSQFAYLSAALIGATFNPWMVFYQQAVVVDRHLSEQDYPAARLDTAVGAVLTQLLTAAVLIAVAAALAGKRYSAGFQSIGEISAALSNVAGTSVGRGLFSVGMIGASMVAAVVCSLSLAWGLGEVANYKRSLDDGPTSAPWFYVLYVVSITASAFVVWRAPNIVSLNIVVQVVNALMLPLVTGLLIALSVKALPEARRPRGVYLWMVCGITAAVTVVGFLGAGLNLNG